MLKQHRVVAASAGLYKRLPHSSDGLSIANYCNWVFWWLHSGLISAMQDDGLYVEIAAHAISTCWTRWCVRELLKTIMSSCWLDEFRVLHEIHKSDWSKSLFHMRVCTCELCLRHGFVFSQLGCCLISACSAFREHGSIKVCEIHARSPVRPFVRFRVRPRFSIGVCARWLRRSFANRILSYSRPPAYPIPHKGKNSVVRRLSFPEVFMDFRKRLNKIPAKRQVFFFA